MCTITSEKLNIFNKIQKIMKNVSRLTLPQFNHKPRPYTGPSYEEVKALRDKHMPAGMYFHFYKQPLFIV